MKGYYEITDVYAREILDSRGNPTVEVEVILDDCVLGACGCSQRRIYRCI